MGAWCFHASLFIMSHHLSLGGHFVFGANPISIGLGICIGLTLSYLHNILWTSSWILTKFAWIYNWDITKIRFWWPSPNFQGHSSKNWKFCDTFLSAQYLLYQWLDSYQILMNIRLSNLDITKNWLDFGDLDLIFKVTAVEELKIHG